MEKCADWCGRGCTQKEYDWALLRSREMARALGPGWRAGPVHNLGWWAYATSTCGRFMVCAYSTGGYRALLGRPGSYAGRWVGRGFTAREAVNDAINQAVAEFRDLHWLLGLKCCI